jgi:intracellular septation protein
MRAALIQLANDFLSTIVFLVAYFLTGNLYIAVGVSMAIGVVQLAVLKWQRRHIDIMHWLSLALVLALGGASLVTQDGRFVMAKPSVIHFAIGIVMLRRGWIGRYRRS